MSVKYERYFPPSRHGTPLPSARLPRFRLWAASCARTPGPESPPRPCRGTHTDYRSKKLGIVPLVKVRHNANTRVNGVDRSRALAAQDQLCGEKPDPKELASLDRDERARNQKEWKGRMGYGRRWLVEIVFSSFKRRFGDSVMARTMKNIINEIGIKIKIYNRLLDIAREAIMKA